MLAFLMNKKKGDLLRMNKLNITLKENGSVVPFSPDFQIIRGCYGNILICLEVPKSLLIDVVLDDERNILTGNNVRAGAIIKTATGENLQTQKYEFQLVKEFSRDGVDYRLYQRIMPKEFIMWDTVNSQEATNSGVLKIVINVVNWTLDGENRRVEEVVASPIIDLEVSPSTFLNVNEVIDEPSDFDALYSQVQDLDAYFKQMDLDNYYNKQDTDELLADKEHKFVYGEGYPYGLAGVDNFTDGLIYIDTKYHRIYKLCIGTGPGGLPIWNWDEITPTPHLTYKNITVYQYMFSADTTYTDYAYKATIRLSDVTSNMLPSIVFGATEAISGNYAPIAESFDGGIYIYSKVNTQITIPIIDLLDVLVEGEPPSQFKFTLSDDGSYYIVSEGNLETIGELILPTSYNGKPVREVAENGFSWMESVTSLTIPSTYTKLGAHAFDGCSALSKVNGSQANALVSIGDYCFRYCALSDDTDYFHGAFNGAFQSLTTIGRMAFASSKCSLFVVPINVSNIGEYAFAGCTNLKSGVGVVFLNPTPPVCGEYIFDGSTGEGFTIQVKQGSLEAYKATENLSQYAEYMKEIEV